MEVLGYRIERVLGRGGMSVVYLAEDLRLKRQVALKLLAPPMSTDEAFRGRFLEESQLAASLDHPNVVPIYGAGEAGDDLYIAMRYVEGQDLKVLLRAGALAAEPALRICSPVAEALDFAHERARPLRDDRLRRARADPRGGDRRACGRLRARLPSLRVPGRGLPVSSRHGRGHAVRPSRGRAATASGAGRRPVEGAREGA